MSVGVAVVTGANSGIGAAVTRALVGAGGTVAAVGRDRAKLTPLGAELGERLVPFVADLSVPEERRRVLEEIRARFATIDAVVNNAAHVVYDLPLRLPPEEWTRLLETNFFAALDFVRALAPHIPAHGHVVNVSSVTAEHAPNTNFVPYALSKIALDALTEGLRNELTAKDVRVTLVSLGLVDTPVYDKVPGFAQMLTKLKEAVPIWLSPEDVADTILWVLTRPPHVAVNAITLRPQGQRS